MTAPEVPAPGARLVVVSPHLDDAVLSTGAWLAHLAHSGVHVEVLTAFGGDPDQDRAAGAANRRAGFTTTGEAARVRRAEDDEACARLGVHARRLPYDDDEATPRDPAVLGPALGAALRGADVALLPGFPLVHPDHVFVARAAAAHVPAGTAVGLYVEQPYATWQALSRRGSARAAPVVPSDADGRPLAPDATTWCRADACWSCRRRKLAAAGAYGSQLAVLRRWPRLRISAHELSTGGERIAWPVRGGAVSDCRNPHGHSRDRVQD